MNDFERIKNALYGTDLDYIPPVLWAIGQSYAPFAGIRDMDYYRDPKVMLDTQVRFFERFPHVFTIPGIWPDMGSTPIASAFGCPVEFPVDSPPRTRDHAIGSLDEVDGFEVPHPRKVDFTKHVLKNLEYFKNHIPDKVAESFGFLDGHIHLGGPVDRACLIAGHETVFIGMYDAPDRVHQLIDKIIDFSMSYLEEQQEIVGPAKRITMSDHTPGLIGKDHFLEFIVPKLNRIFDATDAELKIYHNENNWNYLVPEAENIRCNVIHAGPEFDWTKANKHLSKCIMGVLDPIGVLANSDCTTIKAKVEEILKASGRSTKMWFSTGGGMHPKTPIENMECMVEAVINVSTKMISSASYVS